MKKGYLLRRDSSKSKNEFKLRVRKNGGSKIRHFVFNRLKSKIIKKFLSRDNSNLKKRVYKITSEKQTTLRFLFLSDLHLEIYDNTQKIKDLLKGETSFDFIIFGGDYFDSDKASIKNSDKWNSLISFLKTKTDNIYGVLGNHDGLNTISVIEDDMKILADDFVCHDDYTIYGSEDFVTYSDIEDLHITDNNNFNIMVSHTPDFIDKIKNNYDLMLSGHTHGGQISLLGYKPVKNCKYKKMFYGAWQKNKINGITTSGVGCAGYPYRMGVYPEIVIVEVN